MATGFPVKANYATGDVLTAANMNDLSGTVNYLQYMPPRNPILNSAFNVWQRGTSFAGTTTAYGPDRWQVYRGVAGSTFSRQTTNDTTNLPNIQYCARVQRDSGNTSTSVIILDQTFETVNSIPFSGKTVTVSFYARAGANFSAVAGTGFEVQLRSGTGTDQNDLTGFTGAAGVTSAFPTLTTTWQRFTATGTVSSSATQLALRVAFTPVGTAGANDYFEITGVQLELGSTANTYMPNQPTYQGELAACERYFQLLGDGTSNEYLFNAFYVTNTTVSTAIQFRTVMRTGPTLTMTSGTNNFSFYRLGANDYLDSLTIGSAGKLTAEIYNNTNASGTQGDGGYLYNRSGAIVGLSAEL